MIIVVRSVSRIFEYKLQSRNCKHINLRKIQINCFKSSASKLNYSQDGPVEFVMNKLKSLVRRYEDMSGITDVVLAQEKVIKAREELIEAQNLRKLASRQLQEIHKKLKSVYVDLDTTKRGEKKYLILIAEEQNLLQEEDECKEKFKEAEDKERQQFDIFSNALNVSHEKERAQSQKVKYWSIIGSIIGTMIGVVGSSINNYFKMSEMKRLVKQSANSGFSNQLEAQLQETKQAIKKIIEFQKKITFNNQDNKEKNSFENLLSKVNNTLTGLEKIINNNCCNGKNKFSKTDPEFIYFQSSITSLKKETEDIKFILISMSLMIIAVPLFSKLFF